MQNNFQIALAGYDMTVLNVIMFIMAYGAVWCNITSDSVVASIFNVMACEYMYSKLFNHLVFYCILYKLYTMFLYLTVQRTYRGEEFRFKRYFRK